jgi:glycosidase
LRFSHEGPDAALKAAEGTLRRNIARLADTALGDPEAPWTLDDGSTGQDAPSPPPQGRLSAPLGPIYFVLLDRFENGDRGNDGEVDPTNPTSFHGGDLAGLTQRLDYLAELGIKTLWLSPITRMRRQNLAEHGAFHGYWMEHPGELDPHLGTEQQLRSLVTALQERDMGLILDQVVNHVAYDSPLVQEHPEWFHGRGDITDWDDATQISTHDVHGLPDLAQENDDVATWLIEHGRSWLNRAAPIGFRLDAVRHVGDTFWQRYNRALREAGGEDLVLLGEVFDGDPETLATTWRNGEFSHLFDFPLYYAMTDTFCREAPLGRLAATLSADSLYPAPHRLVTFADNHDLPRVLSACDGLTERVHQLLAFQFTARGVPAVTYGTEVGITGDSEPANRADMRFIEDDLTSTQTLLRALAHMRREHSALRQGTTRFLSLDKDLFAYLRYTQDEAVVMMVSRSEVERTLMLPEPFASGSAQDLLILPRDAQAEPTATKSPPSTSNKDLSGGLTIPSRSMLVVHLQPREGMSFSPKSKEQQEATPIVLHFSQAPVGPDEQLFVVGAGPQLGHWQPSQGLGPLSPSDSGWKLATEFPVDTVQEYKLVVIGANGEVRWEQGENRYLLVNETSPIHEVQGSWQG